MFKTIVAGSNGRDRGLGAVSLAHAIATLSDARLIIGGVQLNPPVPFESYGTVHEQLMHDLRTVRDERAPGALVHVAPGLSAAHGLVRLAEREHADLIVVGSRHRGRLAQIVESDHAMQVLHGSQCAVAVVPDPLPVRVALRTIGVGIDQTPESRRGLEIAHDLARRSGARLVLRSVVDDRVPAPFGLAWTQTATAALQTEREGRVREARDLVEQCLGECHDVEADGTVDVGDPVGDLTLLTETVDLLVLGSRRWGTVRRVALGSTSERVIHHATCPVLVPPRGNEVPEVRPIAVAHEIVTP